MSDSTDGRNEIDRFLLSFNEQGKAYPQSLEFYNMHILVHLHQDRDLVGPLCFMNAYAYETLLGK